MSAASYPIPRATAQQPGPRARLATLLLAAAALASCAATPITGRRSLNLFSPQDDVAIGRQAYAEILAENNVITSGPELARAQRVMERLVAVADDAGYEWEVNVIDDDATVNAFALPGGKMAVYTGMLNACPTDDALAVVMGHEIGHVVARHGTERMSISSAADLVLQGVDANEYAVGAQLAVSLLSRPHGRRQESESDHIGIIYMARAGYDPREAPAFWGRMSGGGGGSGGVLGGVEAFLSTHPSHETRMRDLEAWLPEALAERPRP